MNVAESNSGRSYLTDGYSLRSWLLTTDHKRIAILYCLSITLFFFIGGIGATLMRYNLISPEGLLGSAETYNKLFTMHGVVMVWFFLIPAIPTTLGNFLVPLMLGARDLAFPRLNLLSWYLYVAAGLIALYSLFAGGVGSVRGHEFGTQRGAAAWAAQVTLTPGHGAVRPEFFADEGQAADVGRLRDTPVLSGAGAGLALLGGLVRAEISYPLTQGQGRGARFDLVFGGIP